MTCWHGHKWYARNAAQLKSPTDGLHIPAQQDADDSERLDNTL